MIIEDAIYKRLLDTDAVTALVLRNVYRGFRSQSSALPCVTFLRTSTEYSNGAAGSGGTQHVNVQVDVWSEKQSEAREIADAVFDTLDGWQNATSPSTAPAICTAQMDISSYPEDGGGMTEYRVEQDWSIWLTP